MPATTYAINKMLDYEFGSESYTPPTTYYLGLSTTVIDATGSTVTEPEDTDYARVALVNDKTTWSTAESGSLVNITSASFAESSEAWGKIYSAFLADHLTDNAVPNIYYYYTLDTPLYVGPETIIEFDAGKITATRT